MEENMHKNIMILLPKIKGIIPCICVLGQKIYSQPTKESKRLNFLTKHVRLSRRLLNRLSKIPIKYVITTTNSSF